MYLKTVNTYTKWRLVGHVKIKNDRLAKNLPVYDGGLGENPVPQPKCMIEELKM